MGERQFGPYRLVHQIAVGGMAEIHLAKTGGLAGFEKYVALKMIHPNFSQDENFIQMLIDEAKITVQLQHVNIAQTFDLGRVGDTFYITMEFVDGSDLYQVLRRGAERDLEMPADVCAFITKEVATGLDYAHRKRDHGGTPLGIVHRDVSPQNVLISHSGEVKVVDFGIAKATMRARQTAVGVIKGKYYYMSPEQAWGDPVDHRTDVFSVGILLYEMLTGQMLYLEEDMKVLLDMVRKADIPPPTTLRPDIPPQLERIVMHALQKRANDRYRTAADLAADLERFLHVYSPVFTAAKLAQYIGSVVVVPPVVEAVAAPPPATGMRSARRITQQLSEDDFVRDRSEFTDENSVIFRVNELAGVLDEEQDVDTEAGVPEQPAADVPSARLPAIPRSRMPPPRSPTTDTQLADDFTDGNTVIDAGPLPFDARELLGTDEASSTAAEEALSALDAATIATPRPTNLSAIEAATVARPKGKLALPTQATAAERALDAPTAQANTGGRGATPPPAKGLRAPSPDPLDAPTVMRPRKASPAAKAASPDLLAARNPRPAVSSVREPRRSRRTPARGITSLPGGGSVISKLIDEAIDDNPSGHAGIAPASYAGDPDPDDFETGEQPAAQPARPANSGLPTMPLAAPQQAPEASAAPRPPAPPMPPVPPMLPAPHVAIAPAAMPGGEFGPTPNPAFTTQQRQLAYEVDALPDQYKVSGARIPSWALRAALAAACVAIGVIIGVQVLDSDQPAPTANINVVSIPPGATVAVDGAKSPGVTPLSVEATPGVVHKLMVTAPGHEPWNGIQEIPAEGGEFKIVAPLRKVSVTLTIESTPPGAEVFVNGVSRGRTPLVLKRMDPSSTAVIELRAEGYSPSRQTMQWTDDTEQQLAVTLAKNPRTNRKGRGGR